MSAYQVQTLPYAYQFPKPYADLIVNMQHCLKTIAEESDIWHKVVYATELFEGIYNTPRRQAFLLGEAEGEQIFLQIKHLIAALETEPIAKADLYYLDAVNEIETFMKLGQLAMDIRRNPDTAESKYNQTILFQYQSLLGRTPERIPYDGLGDLLKKRNFTLEELETTTPVWERGDYSMEFPKSLRNILS